MVKARLISSLGINPSADLLRWALIRRTRNCDLGVGAKL